MKGEIMFENIISCTYLIAVATTLLGFTIWCIKEKIECDRTFKMMIRKDIRDFKRLTGKNLADFL